MLKIKIVAEILKVEVHKEFVKMRNREEDEQYYFIPLHIPASTNIHPSILKRLQGHIACLHLKSI